MLLVFGEPWLDGTSPSPNPAESVGDSLLDTTALNGRICGVRLPF